MRFKDHFSDQAADYTKYRPNYPNELFAYLASLVLARECAWDCGTGSGQAAVALTEFFDRVIATDASEKQILSATKSARVEYRIAPAENSGLSSHSLDLIAVAQALHWFDLDAFYMEAKRVLKPEGALAVWGYGLLEIAPEIDAVINRFYREIVGPYWPPERKIIESRYQTIPFPFAELQPPQFAMKATGPSRNLLVTCAPGPPPGHSWSRTEPIQSKKSSLIYLQLGESRIGNG